MAPRWPLLSLLLHALLYRGEGEVMTVNQTPTLQATLAHETVSVTCRVTALQTNLNIAVGIYRVDMAGQETRVTDVPYSAESHPAPTKKNHTLATLSFRFRPVNDPHSTGSSYYCIATAPGTSSTRFRGEGTFFHVRDTGYVRNRPEKGLPVFLKTTCGLLTALSLVGTGLLLFWKKKGYPTWSSVRARQADGGRTESLSGCSSRAEVCTPGSIYTSLEPHSADIYNIIEQEVESQPSASVQEGPMPSMEKHKQLEKKISPEVQAEGKKRTSDKTPRTAAKQAEVFDTVYENL
ncbi:hypothetical protein NDU88_000188 [Pleurodeles waltl]|uniref:NFAM1 Ig-like domain-containing protein n=1 Tax=Pleurodeles waltl TaxID=8319 RepID=A0AAV7KLM7_PLEWA|nr:hypothetical protein NDU88_000188 [Pleurodeles waltl]